MPSTSIADCLELQKEARSALDDAQTFLEEIRGSDAVINKKEEMEKKIQVAGNQVNLFRIELRGLSDDVAKKDDLTAELNRMKDTVDKLKKQFKNSVKMQQEKQKTLAAGKAAAVAKEEGVTIEMQESKPASAMATMDKAIGIQNESLDMLDDGIAVVVETQQIAQDTLMEMKAQSDQMARIKKTTDEVSEEFSVADALIKSFKRGVMTDKIQYLMLILIIIGGVVACVLNFVGVI